MKVRWQEAVGRRPAKVAPEPTTRQTALLYWRTGRQRKKIGGEPNPSTIKMLGRARGDSYIRSGIFAAPASTAASSIVRAVAVAQYRLVIGVP